MTWYYGNDANTCKYECVYVCVWAKTPMTWHVPVHSPEKSCFDDRCDFPDSSCLKQNRKVIYCAVGTSDVNCLNTVYSMITKNWWKPLRFSRIKTVKSTILNNVKWMLLTKRVKVLSVWKSPDCNDRSSTIGDKKILKKLHRIPVNETLIFLFFLFFLRQVPRNSKKTARKESGVWWVPLHKKQFLHFYRPPPKFHVSPIWFLFGFFWLLLKTKV